MVLRRPRCGGVGRSGRGKHDCGKHDDGDADARCQGGMPSSRGCAHTDVFGAWSFAPESRMPLTSLRIRILGSQGRTSALSRMVGPQPWHSAWHSEGMNLTELAPRILDGAPRLGATRLVTIDGLAGAGKSTLADQLAEAVRVGVQIIHMDDLYEGWTGLNDELFRRVTDSILAPLSRGEPAAYAAFDWQRGAFRDETRAVRPEGVVILEGVGAGDTKVRRWATLSVWLDVPEQVGIQRAQARDTDVADQDWEIWTGAQRRYFAEADNRACADMRLEGLGPH